MQQNFQEHDDNFLVCIFKHPFYKSPTVVPAYYVIKHFKQMLRLKNT